MQLDQILCFSPLLPAQTLAPPLITILFQTLEQEDPKADYARSPENAAWVLQGCLKALSSLRDADLQGLDAVDLVLKAVHGWGWSAAVLEGVTSLISRRFAVRGNNASNSHLRMRIRRSNEALRIEFETLYRSLSSSISSHKRNLRLAALRLLLSPIVQRTSQESSTLQSCLEAEVIDLDVAGARERVVKTGKVTVSTEGLQVDLAGKWLTGGSSYLFSTFVI